VQIQSGYTEYVFFKIECYPLIILTVSRLSALLFVRFYETAPLTFYGLIDIILNLREGSIGNTLSLRAFKPLEYAFK
jgi:hypothetical protein